MANEKTVEMVNVKLHARCVVDSRIREAGEIVSLPKESPDLYGKMQPFAATARIEQRQTLQLSGIFDKYGVTPAHVPGSALGSSQATTKRAGCVQVLDQVRHFQERLYNERNAFVLRPDIRRYMQEAAQMSRDTLLPAFENCAKDESP